MGLYVNTNKVKVRKRAKNRGFRYGHSGSLQ